MSELFDGSRKVYIKIPWRPEYDRRKEERVETMTKFISREALGETLESLKEQVVVSYAELVEAIAAIPATDVRKVVHGKWKHGKFTDVAPKDIDVFYCSKCGEPPWWCGVTEEVLPRFCPNCGADMRQP